MTSHRRMPRAAGVGLRLPHLAEVTATLPAVGWLEIHPENFLANPHATEMLTDLSRHYPISVHTVGISIGSVEGIDRSHLARLRTLIDAIDPILVSGHLAWSTHEGAYLNDLLPLPFDEAALQLVAAHLHEVQDGLGRPYVVENPSSYVAFETSTMPEVEFLGELVHRTGCQLLCDVSNVYLSAHNMGYDPYPYHRRFAGRRHPRIASRGVHARRRRSHPGSTLLVDTHATPITEPVWDLYAYALRRFGPTPTIIEWDDDIPALDTLVGEAARADAVGASVLEGQEHRAHAR